MTIETSLNRRDILIRIIGAGINISPNALNLLSNAGMSNKDIEGLIREISFVSNFKSHITLAVLQQTKYSNLIETQKKNNSPLKTNFKSSISPKSNYTGTSSQPLSSSPIRKRIERNKRIARSENNVLNELSDDFDSSKVKKNDFKQDSPQKSSISVATKPQNIDNKIRRTSPIAPRKDKEIEIASKIADEVLNKEKKGNDQVSTTSQSKNNAPKSRADNMHTMSEKIGDFGGLRQFNPIARDHYDQVEVIRDSSREIYTEGSIDDFYNLMNDRFVRLKKIILQSYSDAKDAVTVKQLFKFQNSQEVKLIAMVKDKRQVGQSNHYKITVEDPTGEIELLVRNTDDNQEIYTKILKLLNDHVIYIAGYLKVDTQRRSRIIFVNELEWPDIPTKKNQLPETPISMALISDVHFGSTNFMEKLFGRFISYLKGEVGNQSVVDRAGSIKYLLIAGDLVDGIGIYPNQDKELVYDDIYKQYSEVAKILREIPDYIKIIYLMGNHEPVRNALPQPIVPKKYCPDLLDMGVSIHGNPSTLSLHGIKTVMYHGDSIIDMNTSIPGLSNEKPEEAMTELLRCRHMAPIFGKKTGLAPTARDYMVMEEVPHVFHTGHVHINGSNYYNGVLNVNSGCFQSQTVFMKSLGIKPTPGFPVVVSIKNGKLLGTTMNLN